MSRGGRRGGSLPHLRPLISFQTRPGISTAQFFFFIIQLLHNTHQVNSSLNRVKTLAASSDRAARERRQGSKLIVRSRGSGGWSTIDRRLGLFLLKAMIYGCFVFSFSSSYCFKEQMNSSVRYGSRKTGKEQSHMQQRTKKKENKEKQKALFGAKKRRSMRFTPYSRRDSRQ